MYILKGHRVCVLASSPRRRLGEGQGGVQALGAEAFLEALGGSLSLRGLLPGKVSGRQGSPGWAPSPIWGQQQGASATGSLPRKSQAQLLRKGPSTGEREVPPPFENAHDTQASEGATGKPATLLLLALARIVTGPRLWARTPWMVRKRHQIPPVAQTFLNGCEGIKRQPISAWPRSSGG